MRAIAASVLELSKEAQGWKIIEDRHGCTIRVKEVRRRARSDERGEQSHRCRASDRDRRAWISHASSLSPLCGLPLRVWVQCRVCSWAPASQMRHWLYAWSC